MSESDKKSFMIAVAGVAAGVALAGLYFRMSQKEPEEVKKVKKIHYDDSDIDKSRSFTMKKGLKNKEDDREFTECLTTLDKIGISKPPHLNETHDCDVFTSPLLGDPSKREISGIGARGFLPDEAFTTDAEFIIAGRSHILNESLYNELKLLRAGPRKEIYFNPDETKAAIVTCGGLCPGLNVVIREIVMCLYYNYGVKDIYGIKWGYRGFHKDEHIIKLTPSLVKDIHNSGGSFLGASRGGFDAKTIINAWKERGINQIYVIGGDGTHKGIFELFKYVTANLDKISVIGIPKTIDNDVPIIDKSFGFDTACGEAERIIAAANCEAESAENGVGLVKVMGRDSGYIAAFSTLASRNVNICLIPESPFEIEGDYGLWETVCKRLQAKGHCVIVVAEGADDAVLDFHMEKGQSADAGGHIKHGDIGVYLKDRIVKYGKEKYEMEITLKYIDPTYAIRSVRSNAIDTIFCTKLAQNAVHGAMAGFTGFSIGIVRDVAALIPIKTIIDSPQRKVDVLGLSWQRVLASTGQPQMVSPDLMYKVIEKIAKDEEAIHDSFKKKPE